MTGTAFGQPYAREEQASPPRRVDALAAAVTVVVLTLVGAPVGLLWVALAPRAQAVLAGGEYLRADPSSDAYIAGDGYFLAAVVLAGAVSGLLVWWLGRLHGPAVVPALALGGLSGAFVAMRVGELVALDQLRSAISSGAERIDINLQLGAVATLAGWPAAALLAFLAASVLAGRSSVEADRPARQLW